MKKFYSKLENIVRKYATKPLVITSLAGILAYGNLAYANRSYNNDILVNAYTEGVQLRPDIAMNDNGDTVVTWDSYYQNYSLYDVFAQRFDSKMNKQGEEFQVNPPTKDRCGENYIAMDKERNFIISWVNSNNWRAYAQRFDKDGNRDGEGFRVSPTESEQREPRIGVDREGNFLIAFKYGYGNAYAQRFNKEGERIGEEFRICGYDKRIGMDLNGDFIVTGAGDEALGASRYNWNGNLIYSVLVSLSKANGADSEIGSSSITMNDNEFVVAWKDYNNTGSSSYGVYARRFNRNGNSLGEEFLVNSGKIMCYSSFPDVAIDKEGKFIIIWTISPRSIPEDVYAQRFDKDGNRIGDEFRVNDPDHPMDWLDINGSRIAMNSGGDFVITWGSGGNIYAKKFQFYNEADLNHDGYINFKDYALLTNNWQKSGPNIEGDIDKNGTVDYNDLKNLADNWLAYCD